jgi:hypothetical protein
MGKKIKCKRCGYEGKPSVFSYRIGTTDDGVPIHKLKELCPLCVLDGIEKTIDECEATNDPTND